MDKRCEIVKSLPTVHKNLRSNKKENITRDRDPADKDRAKQTKTSPQNILKPKCKCPLT